GHHGDDPRPELPPATDEEAAAPGYVACHRAPLRRRESRAGGRGSADRTRQDQPRLPESRGPGGNTPAGRRRACILAPVRSGTPGGREPARRCRVERPLLECPGRPRASHPVDEDEIDPRRPSAERLELTVLDFVEHDVFPHEANIILGP